MLNNDTTSDEHGNIVKYNGMPTVPASISYVENTDISIVKTEPMSPKGADTYQSLSGYTEVVKSPISRTATYKLKDPIIMLERCDKIWETLKFIKTLQDQTSDDEDGNAVENQHVENSNTHSKLSYITYHPVLNNTNGILPNFKFSVKRKTKLFHCYTCGKEYREPRSLRSHSQKIHGIIIPQRRYNKPNININSNFKQTITGQHLKQTIDRNNEENVKQNKQYIENCFDQTIETEQKSSVKEKGKNSIQSDVRPLAKRTNECDVNSEHEKNASTKDSLQRNDKNSSRSRGYMHTYETCPLCKRKVKTLTKHFMEYHKINRPNDVIRHFKKEMKKDNLSEAIQSGKEEILKESFNESNKNIAGKRKKENNEELNVLLEKKYKSNHVNKESVNTLHENTQLPDSDISTTRTCDICFGTYASSTTYYKHRRTHRLRGENKNNFHRCNNRYHNSPLYNARATNQSMLNKALLNSSETQSLQHYEINNYNGLITSSNNTCICGESFQDAHTLFLHKTDCKCNDIDEESLMDFDGERDIGGGISITIKKKNDSYEIVGKDNTDENTKTDLDISDNCQISNEVPYNNTSSNHSFVINSSKHKTLRQRAIEKNSIIQMTKDSTNAAYHINNETNEFDIKIEKMEENDNPHAVPTLTELCETILTSQSESSNLLIKEPVTRISSHKTKQRSSSTQSHANLICPCGAKFQTSRGCNSHVARCHPSFLKCGYCSEKFQNISEYNNHSCNVTSGKAFKELISCIICNDQLESTKMYDKHVALKHYNPDTPYLCYACPKQFISASARHSHYSTKHNNNPCSTCGQQLSLVKKLKHEGYHHGLGFPCHICKVTYSRIKTLHNHQTMIHSKDSDELVTCKLCFKTMKNKSLTWHLYAHRNVMCCKVCNRIYPNKKTLEHHIIVRHKGIYPWKKCNLCARNFITNNFLELHLHNKRCLAYTKKDKKKVHN